MAAPIGPRLTCCSVASRQRPPAQPLGRVAARELASDVFDVVAHPARLAQVGNDPGGEGVAPDVGEVLAEQVGRSRAVADNRRADHLDVVAFPVHLPANVTTSRSPGNGVEVGEGELEGRVGFNGEAQCFGGTAAVDGPLRLAVPRSGPQARADDTTMALNRWPGGIQVTIRANGLTFSWLHVGQVARAP